MTKHKKQTESVQCDDELLLDLQRTRADFENYRKNVEREKKSAYDAGEIKAILKLLPVIDTLERAVVNVPKELSDNAWAQGIVAVSKQLDKQLKGLGLEKIVATPGTAFDPELHQAVQFDDAVTDGKEVIAEELRAGYIHHGSVVRDAMVKVTRQ